MVWVHSPDMVPSGCDCNEITFHDSSSSRSLHFRRELVTASQCPPTLSNTTSFAGYRPPVDAVATQPLAPHADRSCHVSENPAASARRSRRLPLTMVFGPKAAMKVPVKGPLLGCAGRRRTVEARGRRPLVAADWTRRSRRR